MSYVGVTETVTTFTYECDNCHKVETVSEVIGEGAAARSMGASDPIPEGWKVMWYGRDEVAFHTQRCAIGFYRKKVDEVWSGSKAPRGRRKSAPSVPLGLVDEIPAIQPDEHDALGPAEGGQMVTTETPGIVSPKRKGAEPAA